MDVRRVGRAHSEDDGRQEISRCTSPGPRSGDTTSIRSAVTASGSHPHGRDLVIVLHIPLQREEQFNSKSSPWHPCGRRARRGWRPGSLNSRGSDLVRQRDERALELRRAAALQIGGGVDADKLRALEERVEDRGDLRAATRLRAVVVLAADDGSAKRTRSAALLSSGSRGSSRKRVSFDQRFAV